MRTVRVTLAVTSDGTMFVVDKEFDLRVTSPVEEIDRLMELTTDRVYELLDEDREAE